MTESNSKQRTFDGKFIDSKEVKIAPKKEKCLYCGKRFKSLVRHLNHCKKCFEYKERTNQEQTSIIGFCQEVTRKSYPIEQIYPNSWNVNSMNQEDFESLKESIQKTKGEFLKQNPIQIRKIDTDHYEIIDGEHRWRACKELKFSHIPAIIETDVDIEKAKVMTVLYSKNRGKIDYFKLSKLLNGEYYDENGKKNYTQKELAEKFGLSGKSEVSEILKIYQRLNIFFDQSSGSRTFTNDKLISLSRCKEDSLREKLIEQTIKNEWSSKEIRKQATKLNKISKFLDNEFRSQIKECILTIYSGNALFELTYDKLIEKLFHQFIENSSLKCILKFNRDFIHHDKIAEDFKNKYVKEHKTLTGWYKVYSRTPMFRAGAKMTWNFFNDYYHNKVLCFKCKKPIKNFNQYSPHHEEYEFKDNLIWHIFIDGISKEDQKIFPCCNKCHQPGNSTNWKKRGGS